MNVRELIAALQKFNPNAEVRLMGSFDGDDVRDYVPGLIHDEWTLKTPHDMVSIEFDRTED